jgi:hypothetical protein
MKWRKGLREGSFRNVPFMTERSGLQGGRRIEQKDHAKRDQSSTEDLGRNARRYSIAALVIGDDYMKTRNRLIEALETEVAGQLMHHYLGELRVEVESYSVNEQAADGRMASFDITFIEAGTNRFPSATPDTQTKAEACAERGLQLGKIAFCDGPGTSNSPGTGYNVGGHPNAVADAAMRVVVILLGDLISRAGSLVSEGAPLTDFIEQTKDTTTNVAELALDPTALATRTLALIAAFAGLPKAGLVTTPAGPVLPVLAFTRFGAELAPPSGPSVVARAIATNQTAYRNLVRRGAIIEAAAISARLSFESHNDALAVRDRLAEEIDDLIFEASDAGDADFFQALSDLRAAVVRDLTTRAADLTRIVPLTLGATGPTLAVANRLYGDDPTEVLARAEDMARRNKVRHPGFVPGGDPIEVPANA